MQQRIRRIEKNRAESFRHAVILWMMELGHRATSCCGDMILPVLQQMTSAESCREGWPECITTTQQGTMAGVIQCTETMTYDHTDHALG